MATGFGFCPNCGAALTEAGQRFCAACGSTLPVAASAAAGVPPAPAVVPPAPAVVPPAPAVVPPAPAVVPPAPASPPPPPPWAMQPVAPVGPTAPRTAVNPALVLVGALAIVAIGAAGVLAMNGSKASPSGSAGYSGNLFGSAAPSHLAVSTPTPRATPTPGGVGSLKVQPAKFDCSDTTTQVTMTILLPAGVEASAEVTAQLDGEVGSTEVVSDNFKKQPDGRWLSADTQAASDVCSAYGAGPHTFAVLDSDSQVLAKGSFNITDEAAPTPTATPDSSGGLIVVEPSTISCTGTTGDVTLSIWLPGSVSGSEKITAGTDVSKGDPEAVNVEFVRQSDGRWFLKDTLSVPNLCSSLDTGKHVLSITDSHDNVLAVGAIDLEP